MGHMGHMAASPNVGRSHELLEWDVCIAQPNARPHVITRAFMWRVGHMGASRNVGCSHKLLEWGARIAQPNAWRLLIT